MAVVKHLKLRGVKGLVWFHVPQGFLLGGKRSRKGIAIQGSIAKGMGVRAGVSDLIFLHKGRAFALELKADGGRTTEPQDEFLLDWNNAGGSCFVAEGLDKALKILEAWGLLVGSAQTSADYNAEDDLVLSELGHPAREIRTSAARSL